jgi:hypothetical protein
LPLPSGYGDDLGQQFNAVLGELGLLADDVGRTVEGVVPVVV